MLVVGDRSDHGFAALRTRHFAEAVGDAAEVVDYREDVVEVARTLRPRALVTAGNHGPTRAALRILGEVDPALPTWIDVAGDPFAEAQAAAGEDRPLVAAEATAVWAPALARGDAFSTVCDAGRDALYGALGVLGRVPLWEAGREPLHVLPCAADFGDAPGEPRGPGLRVVLLGGFNTWFDDETLAAGLEVAMARADVTVEVFGGAIVGHHEAGFARFRDRALRGPWADRYRFRGWVPHAELALLTAGSHVTVCLDRPGAEARLGARTRVLYALHRGLRVLATPASPVVAEAVIAGLVEPLDVASHPGVGGGVEALAVALLEPRGAPPMWQREQWLAARSVAATTGALRQWAAAPARSVPAPAADALLALTLERDRARTALAEHRSTASFRLLDRVNRLLRFNP